MSDATVILQHGDAALLRIDPQHAESVEQFILPFLRASIGYTEGFQSVDELMDAIRQPMRSAQVWAVARRGEVAGAFITTLERVESDLVMQFEIIGGVEAQSWIAPLIAKFETYMAEMFGVTCARVIGRRGWERFLARYGYRASHFITSKRLLRGIEHAGRMALQ